METNLFKASIVFKDGDLSAGMIRYPKEPAQSDDPIVVTPHSSLGVNCVLVRDCYFFMYKNHNPKLVYNSKNQHIVADKTHNYTVCAFLGKSGDELKNGITIIAKFPEGTVMSLLEACSEVDVYCFSGFNVMLFDEIPNVE
jgi:hypothetical protein